MKKIKKKWKQWISVGVAFAMAVGTITGVGVESQTVSAQTSYGLSNPTVEMQTRECIQFGSYWQKEYTPEKEIENPVEGEIYTDTDSKSTKMIYQGGKFFKKSPITWQILKQDGDDLFLLADQVLDCKMYNENGVTKTDSDGETYTDYSCTWETSTLRSWLNGEFYDALFTDEEKKAIKETEVKNEDNPDSETMGGNDTRDHLFLLSLSDIINMGYGFSDDMSWQDQTRQAQVTDFTNSKTGYNYSKVWWWLRSPGYSEDYVSYVFSDGDVRKNGYYADYSYGGVRPVLHVNLADAIISSKFEKKTTEEIALSKTTWDTVEFGTYRGKKISWRVLSVDGEDAFLLADQVLLGKSYNDSGEYCTWETCSLRKWLNDDFFKEIFSLEEQKAIIEQTLTNENNFFYGTSGGNATVDSVFLLSMSDIVNKLYGFPTVYNCDSVARQTSSIDGRTTSWWWLRTPGNNTGLVSTFVINNGHLGGDGSDVDDWDDGVRPALHLNLSHTDVWTKGEVVTSEDKKTASTDSQPDGEPTKTPTQTPTSTKTPDTPADTTQSTPTTNAAGTSTPTQTNTDNGVTKGQNVKAPAKVTSLKVTNKKAGKTVVSFKKVSGAAGYQIQYAKNKKLTKAKKSKTTKKTTYTIKKLKKKTTYYFRVRAYAKDDNGDKVFGKWSTVKKLKIKR